MARREPFTVRGCLVETSGDMHVASARPAPTSRRQIGVISSKRIMEQVDIMWIIAFARMLLSDRPAQNTRTGNLGSQLCAQYITFSQQICRTAFAQTGTQNKRWSYRRYMATSTPPSCTQLVSARQLATMKPRNEMSPAHQSSSSQGRSSCTSASAGSQLLKL
jgi:hypothetical protein